MSGTEAYKHFGLSCSEGGNYYICEDSPVQFIGCCTSDPCGSNNGTCPDGDLRSSTFNSDSYEDLPVQDCDDDRGSTIWYACKFVSPPFMGCCSQNACSNEGCSRSRLIPAKLSSVEKNRLEFLEPDGTSPSSTSTSTSSSSSSSTASDEPSSGGGGLSTGAIAGIAVGAAVVGILVLAFLIWMFWWKPRKNKQDGQQFQPVAQPQQPDTPDAYGQSSFSPAAMTPVMSNHHRKLIPQAVQRQRLTRSRILCFHTSHRCTLLPQRRLARHVPKVLSSDIAIRASSLHRNLRRPQPQSQPQPGLHAALRKRAHGTRPGDGRHGAGSPGTWDG